MPCIRIVILQLSGRHVSPPAATMERALAQADRADLVVLDLFSCQSAAPTFLAALERVRRPVRIVGANKHWKRLLKISRLDVRFQVVGQTRSLCPPVRSTCLQYTELFLGAVNQNLDLRRT